MTDSGEYMTLRQDSSCTEAVQEAPSTEARAVKPREEVERIELRPTESQRAKLDALFSGPVFIRSLVAQHGEPIADRAAASLFLLKHRKELDPHLFAQNRSAAIDWLTGLVQEWSTYPPLEMALAIPPTCTISRDQDIHLSMRQFGPLTPKDKLYLERFRARRRYSNSFVLVLQDGKYHVDITFTRPWGETPQPAAPKPVRAQSATRQQSPRQPVKRPAPQRYRPLPIGALLAMFDSAMNARLMADLRVSQQYSRTQFDKLEGWGVNGGLPSLGKRR